MRPRKVNAGILTNFEVLDFLRSRGASNDASRVMARVSASEMKVYDYLVETTACNQTKEIISEFIEKSKDYNLAQAEVLNIINIRPTQLVELDQIIEQYEERLEDKLDDLVEMIVEVLPPPPNQSEPLESAESGEPAQIHADDEEKMNAEDKANDVKGDQMEASLS